MNLFEFQLPLVVLLPFFGALLAFYSARYNRLAAAWVSSFITLLSLASIAPAIGTVFSGSNLIQSWPWLESIGLYFSFRLDGLSLLFSLLILIIGLLVIIYARWYLAAKDNMGRFFAYLLMFMGSMLGIVLSENLIQLVIFWELTSISSFLLISYWQHRKDARQGARMALTVTAAGGLALLGSVLIIGEIIGSYQLSDVLANGELIRQHRLYPIALILLLLAVFTKSAQFPFHFWLPHAMAAPTPVSAYLHSATMVKAGIFLLARFFPVFSGTEMWTWLVGGAGLITLLIGAYTALFKHDLKALLAYSTISHLGLITLLFGFGTQTAAVAAIFHIINHATFKASLFMVAGIIDHETGTRDMRKLNGLIKYMPHTAALAIIASLAMAGVPLLNGFLSKEMFFAEAVLMSDSNRFAWLVPLLVTIGGILSVAYSLRFVHDVFFNGEPIGLSHTPHEPPRRMKVPIDLLVITCLAVGIFPAFTIEPILNIAVSATLQHTVPEYSLALWHGLTLPLLMSAAALSLGVLVYFNRNGLIANYERHQHINAKHYYLKTIKRLLKLANAISQLFDKGSLQNATAWVIFSALLLGSFGFINYSGSLFGTRNYLPVDAVSLMIAGLLMIAAILTVAWCKKRLQSLISLGVVGLVSALVFVKFSAPDLALTQLSVEVVTIILLLLALYFLPASAPRETSRIRLWRDAILAIASGLAVTLLTLMVLSRDFDSISDFFIANSVSAGGGSNVVNVILVDFRGFDTLGEIVVLALAGLGIYALLHNAKLTPIQKFNTDEIAHPVILQTFSRLMLPLMLLVAAYIFLRGHNLPGGGFIAGLIASVALILMYLANGIAWTSQRLQLNMQIVIALGLLSASATGLAAMLVGYPFLTSAFSHIHWPLVGEFEIASAIAFDLGVFLVVVGASVLSLVQLGQLNQHPAVKEQQ
ncbi:monovalent cation/H+ antiporter subunit A [Thiomicrorhabdus sp. 6S2-11]|uniref:Monovalent cation/H+ antiporter subunit A n=1 Tax=Thiomicrorhabdus marina TaxID=2818442 RepID=A0ABS3Q4U2_9GAMM|nr:monovalent cation/H+ antiporter subunit A [Thiomicrorhabdus marina]